MPNIGPLELLIFLIIALVLFGGKRLKTLGSDLASAIKGFRSTMNEAEAESPDKIGDQSKDANFENTPVDEPSKENHTKP